ncbi:MAG: hypothetical protein HY252_04620 [Sphingobacteriales bacterium]|nr:hypothetical protein [Sphingobacteriales bacterium]
MKTTKNKLSTIQGKLSRSEMKEINGGVVPMMQCTCGIDLTIIYCPITMDAISCLSQKCASKSGVCPGVQK